MMRALLLVLLMLPLLLATAPSLHAQVAVDATPLAFDDAAQEKRFHRLVAELRCVMCQNQSLADSNAQIAHDLRREVLALMQRGMSDAEIKDYLVARYGDFVLYRPRVDARTWLLWFGPLLLIVAGGGVIWRIVRVRGRDAAPLPVDESQEW
ncbi:cytochrome c-type biogenesis protein CcmH [Luteimonas sp. BDR2-5]|uniref:cytochrome c-type biogenesis protein n=1 Tax=Proluteimonas luteida TaxID=2878685 RepID=UPI001E290D1D|nr:cytochrome c-type biogenesis protein [Luteimonas sp. BDR2-5]MCD9028515.1 cytochrome c-type biogenesis protein CcmH [Luteimonas sp. BDR2-5]